MKRMSQICKRMIVLMLAAALLCTLLAVGGAAAEARPANVWINGEPVTFSDAYPRNEAGRVFLPFRAIFEALGAEVDWDPVSRTVIAERNGTLIHLPIGRNEVYITENGVQRVLKMDVAAYISAAEGRTYVPVRFMAQAMGFLVGWDQADQTVILIDPQEIAKEAVKGKDYVYLKNGQQLLATYQSGNWALEGELRHVIEAKGITIAATEAAFTGLSDHTKGSQIFLNMTSDYSNGYLAQAEHLGVTLEDLGVTLKELKAELSVELRTNTVEKTSWMNVSKATGAAEGFVQNYWLEISDVNGINGVDVTGLLAVETTLDPEDLVIEALEAVGEPKDRETAMALLRGRANEVATNLSDQALQRNGALYIARWQTGNVLNVLTMEVGDTGKVISCAWDRTMEGDGEGTTRHTFVDDQGNVTEIVNVIGAEQTDTMVQTGKYAATAKTPLVTPEEK